MLIIYGFRKKLKTEKSLGVHMCPNCSHNTEAFLAKEKCHLHICYIPVFFYTGWRGKVCNNCGIVEKLTGKQYKELINS